MHFTRRHSALLTQQIAATASQVLQRPPGNAVTSEISTGWQLYLVYAQSLSEVSASRDYTQSSNASDRLVGHVQQLLTALKSLMPGGQRSRVTDRFTVGAPTSHWTVMVSVPPPSLVPGRPLPVPPLPPPRRYRSRRAWPIPPPWDPFSGGLSDRRRHHVVATSLPRGPLPLPLPLHHQRRRRRRSCAPPAYVIVRAGVNDYAEAPVHGLRIRPPRKSSFDSPINALSE